MGLWYDGNKGWWRGEAAGSHIVKSLMELAKGLLVYILCMYF